MMGRRLVWLQLALAWVPVWALYATLIATAHPDSTGSAALSALRSIGAAAVLGFLVYRVTERFPWPDPVRPSFVALHLVGAIAYSVAWVGLTSLIESVVRSRVVVVIPPTGMIAYLIFGIWLYAMVAGVAYATRATERAAKAESLAARSQLAALRGQLNPHFLFNALHTVVQLIPREPARAGAAAEQLASLLRTSIEEDRDLVSLAEEWSFVERYLAVERIRFGDRLRVVTSIAPEAKPATLPSFALQTLVENAVRHGAAPKVEPTEIAVDARISGDGLTLTVADTGQGVSSSAFANGDGTGLRRLRERLTVLYGPSARLDLTPGATGGFTASLVIPQRDGD